jgi:hypothetical protein
MKEECILVIGGKYVGRGRGNAHDPDAYGLHDVPDDQDWRTPVLAEAERINWRGRYQRLKLPIEGWEIKRRKKR